ncbi:MAG TPA: anti-sigma regulatory factor [Nocardioidaceae bacterium]|nr:anti-sigma regulatory factor [Nocardioidaceae bacterium]
MDTQVAVESRESYQISTDADVVRVRQSVRTLALAAKLSLIDQTKLVTAVSELARNTLVHGGGGSATVDVVTAGPRRGVRVEFVDHGPGIPDVGLALTDGWSTGNGMGLGLSGARRLVDDFDLTSDPDTGTTVSVVKWTR